MALWIRKPLQSLASKLPTGCTMGGNRTSHDGDVAVTATAAPGDVVVTSRSSREEEKTCYLSGYEDGGRHHSDFQ